MARLDTSGLGDIAVLMLDESEKTGKKAERMLVRGGEVLRDAMKKEVKSTFKSDRTTGALAASIKVSKVGRKGAAVYVDVAPEGKDSKGVRNAEKGFVLEYGRSNMPARPWMARSNERSEEATLEAMREEWEKDDE